MGSRVREDVTHLFECFCEVVKPQPGVSEAWVIQKFPEKYKDEEILKSVPKFAYPCDFDNSVVQHYSFVLTSVDSKWTFGFCRHDPKSETALVILSFLPWHEAFYKLLNHISDLNRGTESDLLWPFLTNVYNSQVPDPGTTLSLPLNNRPETVFKVQAPQKFQLPSIPENRNLTEYYNAVDCDNMITIFASMLYERRIIFTSKRLYRLSACVQAANAIIYPMIWQHIFIPVLPLPLIDYLLAPMPYLIGVPNSLLDKVRPSDIGDVVILDADNNKVTTPFDDLGSLPQDVVKQLKTQLKNRARHHGNGVKQLKTQMKNKMGILGDGVSRAFLRALVQLIGGYRDALKFHQGEKITFSSDAFIESRPANIQPFLRKMLELQIFQQFIEERLAMLNAGLGFSDEFELEACSYCDKTSSRLKAQYKDWASTMKKEGTAFIKSVKTRANPAVKSAVKTVKEKGKDVGKAYKGIRSKFRDFGDDKNRPKSSTGFFPSSTQSYRKDLNTKQRKSAAPDVSNSQAAYSALTPGSPEHGEGSGLQLSPLDMDLMGDMEGVIFSKMCTSLLDTSSQVPERPLKPVRSFENFERSSRSVFAKDHGTGSDDNVFLLGAKSSASPGKPSNRKPEKANSSSSDTQDLIRLDSTPSDDDHNGDDSNGVCSDDGPVRNGEAGVHSLTNPLYPYFSSSIGNTAASAEGFGEPRREDNELLREYGIDFNNFTLQPTSKTAISQRHWTKFE